MYRGRVADLYDLFYGDKDYAAEVAFIDGVAERHGVQPPGPVLDLACGTGRHAQRFEELGYEVTGVDVSPDMIARARARVPAARFHVQDVSDLDVDGTYPLVTFLFDSVGYLVTNDRIVSGLERVRRHLEVDGVAVIEFWHAPAMLREFDPVRVRWWELDEGRQIVRLSRTSLQVVEQTATVEYLLIEIEPDRPATMTEEVHVNRFFQVQEMGLLLATVGLEPVSWHAGFSDEDVAADTWHVVVVARPARRSG